MQCMEYNRQHDSHWYRKRADLMCTEVISPRVDRERICCAAGVVSALAELLQQR